MALGDAALLFRRRLISAVGAPIGSSAKSATTLLTLRCTFGAKRVCVARTRKPDRLDDLLAGRSDLLIAWLGRSIAKQQLPRLLNRRHGAALRDLEVKARRQTKVRPYHSAVIPGASRVGRRGWPWLLLLPSELHSVR